MFPVPDKSGFKGFVASPFRYQAVRSLLLGCLFLFHTGLCLVFPLESLLLSGLCEGVRVSEEVWSGETESLGAIYVSKRVHKIKV